MSWRGRVVCAAAAVAAVVLAVVFGTSFSDTLLRVQVAVPWPARVLIVAAVFVVFVVFAAMLRPVPGQRPAGSAGGSGRGGDDPQAAPPVLPSGPRVRVISDGPTPEEVAYLEEMFRTDSPIMRPMTRGRW